MKDPFPTREDIRKIILAQQRKKNVIPEYASITGKFNTEILHLRAQMAASITDAARTVAAIRLDRLLRKKKEYEDDYCENLRSRVIRHITNQKSTVRLRSTIRDGRLITTFNKPTETLLTFDRYAAAIIKKSFNVIPASRDQSLRVLIDTLDYAANGKTSSRTIFRYDIKQFYDSIDHSIILQKILRHQGIPRFVKQHVSTVLDAYARIHKTSKGIPQGIPTSAALAEIYLHDLDREVRGNPQVALYLRYVDDMLIISDRSNDDRVQHLLENNLNRLRLEFNSKKSKILHHPAESPTNLSFLGYQINFAKDNSAIETIDLSQDKFDRYSKALGNLEKYIQNTHCWANKTRTELIVGCFEYLLSCHTSKHSYDGYRIVTGLAYSAKFTRTRNSGKNGPRKIETISAKAKGVYRKYICPVLAQTNPKCGHCNFRITNSEDLRSLERLFSYQAIMFSQARYHFEDKAREEIRSILWN